MSPHELNALHIVHVSSVLVMIAFVFYAMAAPPETRRWVLSLSGLALLLVLGTGLRMWAGLYSFAMLGWIWVKLACWIGIGALSGLGYRRREHVGWLMVAVLVLAITALAMVYVKPF